MVSLEVFFDDYSGTPRNWGSLTSFSKLSSPASVARYLSISYSAYFLVCFTFKVTTGLLCMVLRDSVFLYSTGLYFLFGAKSADFFFSRVSSD